jgi:Tfp pilus assembly protein PilF
LNAAASTLEGVIKLKMDHVEAHYALARTYQQLGKSNEAAREFKIVSELHAHGAQRSSGIAGSQK